MYIPINTRNTTWNHENKIPRNPYNEKGVTITNSSITAFKCKKESKLAKLSQLDATQQFKHRFHIYINGYSSIYICNRA